MTSSSEIGDHVADEPVAQEAPKSERAADRHWGTPVGLAMISLALVATLALGTTIVGLSIDPEDDANYIVTGLAAPIAALNVLFTLWLLRTAQRQLFLMREQAIEQHDDSLKQITQLKDSHDAERHEANQQLDSLREQLHLAKESHAAERHEATVALKVSQDEVDEALKARLDQLAPRVSVAVDGTQLVLKQRQGTEVTTTKRLPELHTLEGMANCWLELVFKFTITNWGTDPVAATFPSPWENQDNCLLFPNTPLQLQYTFTINTYNMREIAESGLRRNESNPEWVLPVVVNDLGGQVHDYHVWRIHPTPFRSELDKIVQNRDFDRSYSKFAFRDRRYHFLDQRALAAGEELDGPRL